MRPATLFHRLQQQGGKALSVITSDAFEGTKFDYSKILAKIFHRPSRPFPVTVIHENDLGRICNYYDTYMLNIGTSLLQGKELDELPQHEVQAIGELYLEDYFKADIPDRCGVEVIADDRRYALLLEAARDNHGAITSITTHCFFIAARNPDITEKITLISSVPTTTSNEKFWDAPDIQIIDMPPHIKEGVYKSHEVYGETRRDTQSALSDVFVDVMRLLRVLSRAPMLLAGTTQNYHRESRVPAAMGRSAFSPVRTLAVDENEFRRIERERPDEIRQAMRKGGYRIPGLVLVTGYWRESGAWIKPHARCEEEDIRQWANQILQADDDPEKIDYNELAQLVEAFGNRRTQANFQQSPVEQVRLTTLDKRRNSSPLPDLSSP